MMKTQKKLYTAPNMEVHQMGLASSMLNLSLTEESASQEAGQDAKRRSTGLSGNGEWNLPF